MNTSTKTPNAIQSNAIRSNPIATLVRRTADIVVTLPALLVAAPLVLWAMSPLAPTGLLRPVVLSGCDGDRYRTFTSRSMPVRFALRAVDIGRGRRTVLGQPPHLFEQLHGVCHDFTVGLYREPKAIWKRSILGGGAHLALGALELLGASNVSRSHRTAVAQ